MAIEVFNRYEHKYMLDRKTYEKVIEVMDQHMELDSHNENHKPYTIANIYYDTADDQLIRASLQKPKYKEKLRLRAYGSKALKATAADGTEYLNKIEIRSPEKIMILTHSDNTEKQEHHMRQMQL